MNVDDSESREQGRSVDVIYKNLALLRRPNSRSLSSKEMSECSAKKALGAVEYTFTNLRKMFTTNWPRRTMIVFITKVQGMFTSWLNCWGF